MNSRFPLLTGALVVGACTSWLTGEPGYSRSDPQEITCGCGTGDECFEEAGRLSHERGENEETGERLLYLAQCACFEGTVGGCNSLGHFTKDWTRTCEGGVEVARACTITGFIYLHGTSIPPFNGPSFHHDPAASHAAFEKACKSGSKIACDRLGGD